MPNFLETIFGRGDKMKQLPTMAPWQMQAFQNAVQNPISGDPNYQAGSGYLQRILSGDPEAFKQFEAPYLQQFNQQIVPGIAERFAGMGTGAGALSSSGLNNSLGQAATNLSTNLAGLRSGLQMQAAGQALPYAQQPYSNAFSQAQISPFAYHNQKGQQGLLGGLLQGVGQGIGGGMGLGFGGPLMSYFSSLFGGGGMGGGGEGGYGGGF